MLRKGKVVGREQSNKDDLQSMKRKKYLQSGALHKILEEKKSRHRNGKRSEFQPSEETPARVVFDSPPVPPVLENEKEPDGSSRARRFLIDEIDELVDEAPPKGVLEPENLADEVEPENLADEVEPDFMAEVEQPILNHGDNLVNGDGCSNSSIVKKRGKAKLSTVKKNERLIQVTWNDRGQPIGRNSVLLASFLGVLVREVVPYTIIDWRSEPMSDILWASIQVEGKLMPI